ncbi:hypothetical protein KC726_04955 [Candidatus Woesebacteria bacterium]|nr:hypothetical protein [Candidatus Woesebacteria bacterium]
MMHKVDEVFRTVGINISKENRLLHTVLYNPETKDYIGIGVHPKTLDPDNSDQLSRMVSVYLPDCELTAHISYARQEGDDVLIHPSFLGLKTDDYSLQCWTDKYRTYSSTREKLEKAPNIVDATTRIIDRVSGKFVDPFELLCGSLSESQLIKKFLGTNVVVDQEAKIVLKLSVGEDSQQHKRYVRSILQEYQYDEVLEKALKGLRNKIWFESFYSLPKRLKEASQEK